MKVRRILAAITVVGAVLAPVSPARANHYPGCDRLVVVIDTNQPAQSGVYPDHIDNCHYSHCDLNNTPSYLVTQGPGYIYAGVVVYCMLHFS